MTTMLQVAKLLSSSGCSCLKRTLMRPSGAVMVEDGDAGGTAFTVLGLGLMLMPEPLMLPAGLAPVVEAIAVGLLAPQTVIERQLMLLAMHSCSGRLASCAVMKL